MKTDVVLYSIDSYFWLLLLVHLVVSLVIAFIVSRYIKQRFVTQGYEHEDLQRLHMMTNKTRFHRLLFHASLHRNNLKSSLNYFFVFNFSMPVLGYIASLWFAWQLVHTKYEKKAVNTNLLNLDEFGVSFLEVRRVFGEGSFNDLILNKYTPVQKKIHALNVLSNNLTPANLKIIKQTLSSSDDEVRMFGYAIINKAEQKLAKNINLELEIFKEANEKNNLDQVATSAYELAFLYWEILYTELSNEALQDEFMDQVEQYLNIAIQLFTKQLAQQENQQEQQLLFKLSRAHQLYGRFYMRQEKYENAITELTIAQELNQENATFVLPYTAEVYYNLGKYDVVRSILSQLSLLEINATLHPLIEQWKKAS